jgi:hypothetical protein
MRKGKDPEPDLDLNPDPYRDAQKHAVPDPGPQHWLFYKMMRSILSEGLTWPHLSYISAVPCQNCGGQQQSGGGAGCEEDAASDLPRHLRGLQPGRGGGGGGDGADRLRSNS